MKKLNFIWGGILAMSLIACGGSNENESLDEMFSDDDYSLPADIYIDNGADTTANVVITSLDTEEEWEFEIAGLEGESTTLEYGKYHVTAETVTGETIVDEDFKLDEDDYVYDYNLNLTKEDYIVENIEYVVGATGNEIISKTFTYDGKTYDEVDATVIPGELLVAEDWDYNLDEESPEEVTLYDGETRTVRRKLYRASTFILYLELIEMFGDYDWSEEEY